MFAENHQYTKNLQEESKDITQNITFCADQSYAEGLQAFLRRIQGNSNSGYFQKRGIWRNLTEKHFEDIFIVCRKIFDKASVKNKLEMLEDFKQGILRTLILEAQRSLGIFDATVLAHCCNSLAVMRLGDNDVVKSFLIACCKRLCTNNMMERATGEELADIIKAMVKFKIEMPLSDIHNLNKIIIKLVEKFLHLPNRTEKHFENIFVICREIFDNASGVNKQIILQNFKLAILPKLIIEAQKSLGTFDATSIECCCNSLAVMNLCDSEIVKPFLIACCGHMVSKGIMGRAKAEELVNIANSLAKIKMYMPQQELFNLNKIISKFVEKFSSSATNYISLCKVNKNTIAIMRLKRIINKFVDKPLINMVNAQDLACMATAIAVIGYKDQDMTIYLNDIVSKFNEVQVLNTANTQELANIANAIVNFEVKDVKLIGSLKDIITKSIMKLVNMANAQELANVAYAIANLDIDIEIDQLKAIIRRFVYLTANAKDLANVANVIAIKFEIQDQDMMDCLNQIIEKFVVHTVIIEADTQDLANVAHAISKFEVGSLGTIGHLNKILDRFVFLKLSNTTELVKVVESIVKFAGKDSGITGHLNKMLDRLIRLNLASSTELADVAYALTKFEVKSEETIKHLKDIIKKFSDGSVLNTANVQALANLAYAIAKLGMNELTSDLGHIISKFVEKLLNVGNTLKAAKIIEIFDKFNQEFVLNVAHPQQLVGIANTIIVKHNINGPEAYNYLKKIIVKFTSDDKLLDVITAQGLVNIANAIIKLNMNDPAADAYLSKLIGKFINEQILEATLNTVSLQGLVVIANVFAKLDINISPQQAENYLNKIVEAFTCGKTDVPNSRCLVNMANAIIKINIISKKAARTYLGKIIEKFIINHIDTPEVQIHEPQDLIDMANILSEFNIIEGQEEEYFIKIIKQFNSNHIDTENPMYLVNMANAITKLIRNRDEAKIHLKTIVGKFITKHLGTAKTEYLTNIANNLISYNEIEQEEEEYLIAIINEFSSEHIDIAKMQDLVNIANVFPKLSVVSIVSLDLRTSLKDIIEKFTVEASLNEAKAQNLANIADVMTKVHTKIKNAKICLNKIIERFTSDGIFESTNAQDLASTANAIVKLYMGEQNAESYLSKIIERFISNDILKDATAQELANIANAIAKINIDEQEAKGWLSKIIEKLKDDLIFNAAKAQDLANIANSMADFNINEQEVGHLLMPIIVKFTTSHIDNANVQGLVNMANAIVKLNMNKQKVDGVYLNKIIKRLTSRELIAAANQQDLAKIAYAIVNLNIDEQEAKDCLSRIIEKFISNRSNTIATVQVLSNIAYALDKINIDVQKAKDCLSRIIEKFKDDLIFHSAKAQELSHIANAIAKFNMGEEEAKGCLRKIIEKFTNKRLDTANAQDLANIANVMANMDGSEDKGQIAKKRLNEIVIKFVDWRILDRAEAQDLSNIANAISSLKLSNEKITNSLKSIISKFSEKLDTAKANELLNIINASINLTLKDKHKDEGVRKNLNAIISKFSEELKSFRTKDLISVINVIVKLELQDEDALRAILSKLNKVSFLNDASVQDLVDVVNAMVKFELQDDDVLNAIIGKFNEGIFLKNAKVVDLANIMNAIAKLEITSRMMKNVNKIISEFLKTYLGTKAKAQDLVNIANAIMKLGDKDEDLRKSLDAIVNKFSEDFVLNEAGASDSCAQDLANLVNVIVIANLTPDEKILNNVISKFSQADVLNKANAQDLASVTNAIVTFNIKEETLIKCIDIISEFVNKHLSTATAQNLANVANAIIAKFKPKDEEKDKVMIQYLNVIISEFANKHLGTANPQELASMINVMANFKFKNQTLIDNLQSIVSKFFEWDVLKDDIRAQVLANVINAIAGIENEEMTKRLKVIVKKFISVLKTASAQDLANVANVIADRFEAKDADMAKSLQEIIKKFALWKRNILNDASVQDLVMVAKAITKFEIKDGNIKKILEAIIDKLSEGDVFKNTDNQSLESVVNFIFMFTAEDERGKEFLQEIVNQFVDKAFDAKNPQALAYVATAISTRLELGNKIGIERLKQITRFIVSNLNIEVVAIQHLTNLVKSIYRFKLKDEIGIESLNKIINQFIKKALHTANAHVLADTVDVLAKFGITVINLMNPLNVIIRTFSQEPVLNTANSQHLATVANVIAEYGSKEKMVIESLQKIINKFVERLDLGLDNIDARNLANVANAIAKLETTEQGTITQLEKIIKKFVESDVLDTAKAQGLSTVANAIKSKFNPIDQIVTSALKDIISKFSHGSVLETANAQELANVIDAATKLNLNTIEEKNNVKKIIRMFFSKDEPFLTTANAKDLANIAHSFIIYPQTQSNIDKILGLIVNKFLSPESGLRDLEKEVVNKVYDFLMYVKSSKKLNHKFEELSKYIQGLWKKLSITPRDSADVEDNTNSNTLLFGFSASSSSNNKRQPEEDAPRSTVAVPDETIQQEGSPHKKARV